MKRRLTTNVLLSLLVAGALALSACATDSTESDTDSGTEQGTNSEFDQGDVSESVPRGEGMDDTMVSGSSGMDLQTAYFDFDQSSIRSDTRPLLRANAKLLQASGAKIRLEGYCDERGDEEYNLALGERRATSVKRYMENLGVPSSQLRTLSYGEAKPAVPGHNEAAWRYNRRVEFRSRR